MTAMASLREGLHGGKLSFTPHTEGEVSKMLAEVDLESVDDLFGPIPADLRRRPSLEGVPGPVDEPTLVTTMAGIAARNAGGLTCFAGGGAFDEYVPAAVAALASKPEFATAYTPYQPEVSQGVLQALFEYQTLVCRLTGMEVANASLYDGASAVVEAAGLAEAATGRSCIKVSEGVSPRIRQVMRTFAQGAQWDFEQVPLSAGQTPTAGLDSETAAIVLQHPNYLGFLEDVESHGSDAGDAGALTIVITDPIANGLLKRPGDLGADVVVGEGQALCSPVSFGGPYLGIFATREKYLRLLPGRISGETVDRHGRRAYALALQGREQHIRREKASSNICTNQTLLAIGTAISLSWLGPEGLRRLATNTTLKAHYLADGLSTIEGCETASIAPFFREFALKIPCPASSVIAAMAEHGFLAGIDLADDYPALGDSMLISVAAQRTRSEIDRYLSVFKRVIEQ